MAVTVATVAENVGMSRHWKAELVAYGNHKQTSPCLTHLMPLKPDSSVCPFYQDSV
jgi:hypothetical protein